jgi:hypothetical protein
MHQVTVDIEQTGAVGFLMDDVRVPELVVKGLGHENSPNRETAKKGPAGATDWKNNYAPRLNLVQRQH